MDYCDVIYEGDRALAEVVYKSSRWATYAKHKFHGFEYPPNHRMIVKSEFENRRPIGAPPIDSRQPDILKVAETLVQATAKLRSGKGKIGEESFSMIK